MIVGACHICSEQACVQGPIKEGPWHSKVFNSILKPLITQFYLAISKDTNSNDLDNSPILNCKATTYFVSKTCLFTQGVHSIVKLNTTCDKMNIL